MTKQIPHKIALIALLLFAFAAPFYIVRSQTTQLSYNDYLVSAAAVKGSQITPTAPTSKIDNHQSGWVMTAGSSFYGSKVK